MQCVRWSRGGPRTSGPIGFCHRTIAVLRFGCRVRKKSDLTGTKVGFATETTQVSPRRELVLLLVGNPIPVPKRRVVSCHTASIASTVPGTHSFPESEQERGTPRAARRSRVAAVIIDVKLRRATSNSRRSGTARSDPWGCGYGLHRREGSQREERIVRVDFDLRNADCAEEIADDDDLMEDLDRRVGPAPSPQSRYYRFSPNSARLRQPRSSTLPVRGPTPLPEGRVRGPI